MNNVLDNTTLRILNAIKSLGPRNLSRVAKLLNIPNSSVYSIFNYLTRNKIIRPKVIPKYYNLGLANILLTIKSELSRHDSLIDILSKKDFCISLYTVSSSEDYILGYFSIPVEHISRFNEEFTSLREELILREYISEVVSPLKSFIPRLDYWKNIEMLKKEDIKEVLKEGREFFERERYENKADMLDILIISHLQDDARIKLSEISRKIKRSRTTISYHFLEHVRRLIYDFDLNFKLDIGNCLRVLLEINTAFVNEVLNVFSKTLFLRYAFSSVRRDKLFLLLDIPVDEIFSLHRILSMLHSISNDLVRRYKIYIMLKEHIKKRKLPVEKLMNKFMQS